MPLFKKKPLEPPMPETRVINTNEQYPTEEQPITPPKPTPEEERLHNLITIIDKQYSIFSPESFPKQEAAITNNLLMAVFGELRTLNSQQRELINLIKTLKE